MDETISKLNDMNLAENSPLLLRSRVIKNYRPKVQANSNDRINETFTLASNEILNSTAYDTASVSSNVSETLLNSEVEED